MFRNILEEIRSILKDNSKFESELRYVISNDSWCNWKEFYISVEKVNYLNDFGQCDMRKDIRLVADGWIMIREDYAGGVNWKIIDIPDKKGKVKRLVDWKKCDINENYWMDR